MKNKQVRNCSFCDELYHKVYDEELYPYIGELYKRYGKKDRILYEDTQFVVVPSLGPISPCHLLVIPKQHVCSYALLDSNILDNAEKIINALEQVIRKNYGDSVVFEHGTLDTDMRSSNSHNHAHMHIVACNQSMLSC